VTRHSPNLRSFGGWSLADASGGHWRRFAYKQIDTQIDAVIGEAAAEYRAVSLLLGVPYTGFFAIQGERVSLTV
jgi:hypothetical protein